MESAPLLENASELVEEQGVVVVSSNEETNEARLLHHDESVAPLLPPDAAACEEAPNQQQQPQDSSSDNNSNDEQSNASKNNSSGRKAGAARFHRVSLILLTATVWGSGLLFGLYMMGHYLIVAAVGGSTQHLEHRWNTLLPSLYTHNRPLANIGMGAHFLGGSITIMLGAVQLIQPIRQRFPWFHRWTGRLYLICSTMTALGGLLFIAMTGCIGGPTMDIAFSLCAVLTLLSSAQAYRHAAFTKRYDQHELWAWRLYSLMISSWMYRLEYATAEILGIPHDRQHYRYALDVIMDFFFYLPNLLVVELWWRTRHYSKAVWVSNVMSVLMLVLVVVVAVTTLLNAMAIWIPGMLGKNIGNDDDDNYHHDSL